MSTSNRGSFLEEEIEVKPSTELIPDEYEHFANDKKFQVHAFFSDNEADSNNVKTFLNMLSDMGIDSNVNDRYCIDKEEIMGVLQKIKANCSSENAGLIIYFSGYIKKFEGSLESNIRQNNICIQNIWMEFNSYNCAQLKNKPKIFIFDVIVSEPTIQADGRRRSIHVSPYDTPSEADILVICSKGTEDDAEFTSQFCDNIKSHGQKENIITLASCVDLLTAPIIISTLTRNFYFTSSKLRGHHLDIKNYQEQVIEHIEKIQNLMQSGNLKQKNEKKKKLGLFGSLRRTFTQSDNKHPVPSTSAASDQPQTAVNSAPRTAAPTQRRPSGPVATRNRTLSQSEPTSGRSSGKRPPWRN